MHGKLNGKNLQLVTVEAPQFQEATLAQLAFNEGIGSVLQMVPGENMLNLAPLTVYQAAGIPAMSALTSQTSTNSTAGRISYRKEPLQSISSNAFATIASISFSSFD
ncbi:hypothetical protein MXF20_23050 [Pantoea dispersa]|uniref:hypothetical protein n=1 Tax=Pantoea dispersa TaxID=59814 RepID=UPI002DB8768B|nr:hypothetical protein [Pantoea dispersa]MEB5974937.1 hypothetical protein [Pantoea dispersa]